MNRILLAAWSLFTAASILAENPAEALAVGAAIPDVTLRTDKDQKFNLRQEVAGKPAVLIFYRGGWCPFCTRHLSALARAWRGARRDGGDGWRQRSLRSSASTGCARASIRASPHAPRPHLSASVRARRAFACRACPGRFSRCIFQFHRHAVGSGRPARERCRGLRPSLRR